MMQSVTVERSLINVAIFQQAEDSLKEDRVAHSPGKTVEINCEQVVLLEEFKHDLGTGMLANIVPTAGIYLGGLADDFEVQSFGPGHDGLVLRGVCGEDTKRLFAGRPGEVEVEIECLGRVGFEY